MATIAEINKARLEATCTDEARLSFLVAQPRKLLVELRALYGIWRSPRSWTIMQLAEDTIKRIPKYGEG